MIQTTHEPKNPGRSAAGLGRRHYECAIIPMRGDNEPAERVSLRP